MRRQLSTSLAVAATEAWGKLARDKCWTLNIRLSYAMKVSETTTTKHITDFAYDLRRDIPGAALLIGLHTDTTQPHFHGLLFLPRRFVWSQHYPPGISVVGWSWEPWLQSRWRHGLVWARPYDSLITKKSKHGAGEYLARDPGNVWLFGTAPNCYKKIS